MVREGDRAVILEASVSALDTQVRKTAAEAKKFSCGDRVPEDIA